MRCVFSPFWKIWLFSLTMHSICFLKLQDEIATLKYLERVLCYNIPLWSLKYMFFNYWYVISIFLYISIQFKRAAWFFAPRNPISFLVLHLHLSLSIGKMLLWCLKIHPQVFMIIMFIPNNLWFQHCCLLTHSNVP